MSTDPFGPGAYSTGSSSSGSSGSSSSSSSNSNPFGAGAYTDPSTGQTYQAEGQQNAAQGASAPGDGIVWASTQLTVGPFALPITTRGLKDAAVIGAAILFAIIGIALMTEPDVSGLAKKFASGAIPIPV